MKKVLVLDTMDSNGNDKVGHGRIVCKIIKQVNPLAKIDTYKVCDDGGTTLNDKIAEGLAYAIGKDYDIINISLGLSTIFSNVEQLINYHVSQGTIIICASGNNKSCYPASYPNTISVGACDKEGNKTSYTMDNYDILACGEIEVEGKLYQGTSYSCANFTGMLSRL